MPRGAEEIVRFLERRSGTSDLSGEMANRDAFHAREIAIRLRVAKPASLGGFANSFPPIRFL
jgi:hypothetical protein